MNSLIASVVAMVVGWALPLIGLAVVQFARSGRASDIGAMAFWVGLFALLGWALAVVPMVTFVKGKKLVSDLRWSWLGWSALAVVIFILLLTPIMGADAFVIIWYPAVMGGIAGLVFAWLTRSDGKATEPAAPDQRP